MFFENRNCLIVNGYIVFSSHIVNTEASDSLKLPVSHHPLPFVFQSLVSSLEMQWSCVMCAQGVYCYADYVQYSVLAVLLNSLYPKFSGLWPAFNSEVKICTKTFHWLVS